MEDLIWFKVFTLAITTLGEGNSSMEQSQSWCSWTTVDRLRCSDAGFWTGGLPHLNDVAPWGIRDGGVWGQPFKFDTMAHLILPRRFCTNMGVVKSQNIDALMEAFRDEGVEFSSNSYLCEIKVY